LVYNLHEWGGIFHVAGKVQKRLVCLQLERRNTANVSAVPHHTSPAI
jgi:hypothetical protein